MISKNGDQLRKALWLADRNQSEAGRSLERLSSGSRIGNDSGDATSQALADKLKSEASLLGQGSRNLKNGADAVSFAAEAIDSLASVVTRLKEYTGAARSTSLSSSMRQAMQTEVAALQAEYNRIVTTTTVNGSTVLTGQTNALTVTGLASPVNSISVRFGEAQLSGAPTGSAGATARISQTSAGVEANNESTSAALSADGRYTFYTSTATNLIAGDTNGQVDVFRRDNQTGSTVRVSTSAVGAESNGLSDVSGTTGVSADGRYVVFESDASNLVSGDSNGQRDIFWKDTLTGAIQLVSSSTAGVLGNGASTAASVSGDGRYVVFTSAATNLVAGDGNTRSDVFLRDMVAGTTERVSVSSAGVEGNQTSGTAVVSEDGRYVAFVSSASNLVAGDTNSAGDVFVRDRFSAVTRRISTSASDAQSDGLSGPPTISSDGRYVLFASQGTNLVSGDTNGATDIFRKDLVSGQIIRVSTSATGAESNGGTGFARMTAEGSKVVFQSSATNLVSGDTNSSIDVFLKDIASGTIEMVSVGTSGALGNDNSALAGVSNDGRTVAFMSLAFSLGFSDSGLYQDIFVRDVSKTGVNALAGMSVATASNATASFNLLDRYNSEMERYAGVAAATVRRIDSNTSNLSNQSKQLSAASNRVRDADVASELATFLSSSILVDAGTAISAQIVNLSLASGRLLK